MRILFTCGREPRYVRNDVILRAIRKRYQVTEVSDSSFKSLTARSLRLLPRLVSALSRQDFDLIFVGFYGYLLLPWIRRLTDRPILFDAFVSNYDTLCFDRQKFKPDSLPGWLAFKLDQYACRWADYILLDTATHRQYFLETFAVPPEKVDQLYVSCNEALFYPQLPPTSAKKFRVFYYSSYLPLHGIEYILAAAKLLQYDPTIEFRLIGDGLTYASAQRQAENLRLTNVHFKPPVPYAHLPVEIAQADLCLAGPFGHTAKAQRVIPGKLFQFLAMARPVIAGDTPANREWLVGGQDVLFCPTANSYDLAMAILALKSNPRQRSELAENGYHRYQACAGEAVIGQKLAGIIKKAVELPR